MLPTSVVAGSFAGMCSVLVCHPLDTIRTRLQASPTRFHGFFHCAIQTIRHETVLGFYKGFWPPFFSQAVYKSVIFTVSTSIQKSLKKDASSPSPLWLTMFSGSMAGGVNAFLVAPVELARNRLQIQYEKKSYQNSFHCLQSIFRIEGWSGLWRGLSASIYRDSIGVAFYFAGYQIAKEKLPKDSKSSLLLSGAFGGLCFWIVALPFDTIKTIIQVDSNYTHFFRSVKYFVNKYGWVQLYRGWQAAFTRGIPGAAITFYAFEMAQTHLLESC